jgi:5-methylcytosine-specific restriction endonuclease McrA
MPATLQPVSKEREQIQAGRCGGRRVTAAASRKEQKRRYWLKYRKTRRPYAVRQCSDCGADFTPMRGGRRLCGNCRTKDRALREQRRLARAWRAKNKERLRQYFAKYRAEHPELKTYHADYHQRIGKHRVKPRTEEQRLAANAKRREDRPRYREVEKNWRLKNPDKVAAITKRTREKNREKKRLRDRLYRKQNPETYKAGIARSKARNPELYRSIAVKSQSARRARKKNAPVERVSLKRIQERDRSICHLCRLPIERKDRSFDHLIPVLRGGAHAEWNLAMAHNSCNKKRRTLQILSEETREAAEAYIAAFVERIAW